MLLLLNALERLATKPRLVDFASDAMLSVDLAEIEDVDVDVVLLVDLRNSGR